MKKIVHLAKYYQPHLGGVEKHLKEVNQILVEEGYDVSVICFQASPDEKLEETIDGVNVFRIPIDSFIPKLLKGNPLASPILKMKVWTWLAKKSKLLLESDVIQIHDVFWWIWPLYMAVYFKVYLTFHGWEGRYPIRLRDKLHRYYNSMSAKKTIHVGDFISDFYFDKPDYIIYGGVNFPNKVKKPNPQRKLLSNNSEIVFLGRLEFENEIEKYLQLFRLIKEKYPKIKITFVGDGAFRKECQEIGEVMGMIKNPSNYLQKADFICANSYLSILEAQSYGKVVISFYSNLLKKDYLTKFPGSKLMLVETNPKRMFKKIKIINKLDQVKLFQEIRNFAEGMSWQRVVKVYQSVWKV